MNLTQQISTLLTALSSNQSNFSDTLALIEENYKYTPTEFFNGEQHNPAGTNEGSCKVFYFAKLNELDAQDTLALFGEHYQAVTQTPEGSDHANIRQFMQNQWCGIRFSDIALATR